MAIVEGSKLFEHLNLVDSGDQAVCARLVDAAQDHMERQLGFKITTRFGGVGQEAIPESLKQAVLLLGGHWFENREGTLVGVTAQALPYGVTEIIGDFRDYTYG